jgi:quinol-cytochrome oxidoreductase complex cytochrome b subunit
MTILRKSNSRRSFTDMVVHIHPPTVPEETLHFTLSWGLGGMSAMLIFLLFITGILQLLTYEPSVTGAYGSVQAMYNQMPLSGWVRNIHHWSANLLVIISSLHLWRVFLTGAIGTGRRLNWVIGLVLFFLVLSANFSGYLLPWDQLAYWAVTICTSMMAYFPGIGSWLLELFRGGAEVGPATLANFYGLHIAVIPVSLVLFMAWHFWLVRKSGGLVKPESQDDNQPRRVAAVPNLIVREAAVGLSLVAFVLMISVFWNAPLHEQANPGMSPNPAKAPWYFLGFQELLLHLHPVFAICVVPVVASVLLLFLPFWQGAVLPAGIWFGGKRSRRLALWTFAVGTLFTFLLVVLDEVLLRTGDRGSGMVDIISRGYFPVFSLVLGMVAGYLLLRKFRFSRSEAVMANMIFCWAVLIALTIIGIWLRGPGMQLTWLL